MTTAAQSDPIQGETYPATKDGFAKLLSDANKHHAAYRLITIVRLDKALAAIYEKRPPKTGDSFFEESW